MGGTNRRLVTLLSQGEIPMNLKSLQCPGIVRKALFLAVVFGVALILQLGSLAGVAKAAVELAKVPDINIGFLSTTGSTAGAFGFLSTTGSTAGAFGASGYSDQLRTASALYETSDGSFVLGNFTLSATFLAGQLQGGGTFNITGGPTAWGSTINTVLLSGGLTGYVPPFGTNTPAVFLFDTATATGSAATGFADAGTVGAILLEPWSQSADVGVLVPEPASLVVWGLLAAFGIAAGLRCPWTRRAA
jgi:hypothetical protein